MNNKISAIKILKEAGHINIVEVEMKPEQYLDRHSHNWDVDLIILEGSLSIVVNNDIKKLYPGDRYKLKKKIEHTEFSGKSGVKFLTARPIN